MLSDFEVNVILSHQYPLKLPRAESWYVTSYKSISIRHVNGYVSVLMYKNVWVMDRFKVFYRPVSYIKARILKFILLSFFFLYKFYSWCVQRFVVLWKLTDTCSADCNAQFQKYLTRLAYIFSNSFSTLKNSWRYTFFPSNLTNGAKK